MLQDIKAGSSQCFHGPSLPGFIQTRNIQAYPEHAAEIFLYLYSSP